MGIFRRLFGLIHKPPLGPVNYLPGSATPSVPGYSDRDVEVIASSAHRMIEVITESMRIAQDTSNPDTKSSRVGVARDNLRRLQAMQADYPFLVLENLPEVDADLTRLEAEAMVSDYAALADGNGKGQALEKEGRIEEAIEVYQRLTDGGTDTPFTYRRLAILHRKGKDTDAELAVLEQAIRNVPESNTGHHGWFVDRRDKLLQKLGLK
jgi:tetratricopeptide (TPR) repeat protein